MKDIKFTRVSSLSAIDHLIPWNAQFLYSVSVDLDGAYGTSVTVTLTPDTDPCGWDSFESDLAAAIVTAYRELDLFEEWDHI